MSCQRLPKASDSYFAEFCRHFPFTQSKSDWDEKASLRQRNDESLQAGSSRDVMDIDPVSSPW